MLKVSSVLMDTPSQSLLPLIDSSINDAVINVAVAPSQLVVLSNGRRHRSSSGRLAVVKCRRLRKFINSLFFSHHTFSTLSTLIKTLSSDNNFVYQHITHSQLDITQDVSAVREQVR